MTSKKLNLGCGKDIRSDYINLDCVALPGVDIVGDISQVPLPFEDNTFDEILCQSILEHVDYIAVLQEIYRILKPGGSVKIIVPHFTSKYAYTDPTHCHFFSIQTLLFFVADHPNDYYFSFHFSKAGKTHIAFNRKIAYFYNYLLEPIVNQNIRTQDFYEGSIFRIFPATDIEVVLIK